MIKEFTLTTTHFDDDFVWSQHSYNYEFIKIGQLCLPRLGQCGVLGLHIIVNPLPSVHIVVKAPWKRVEVFQRLDSAYLVPWFIGEPLGGWIFSLVSQRHSTGDEEIDLLMIKYFGGTENCRVQDKRVQYFVLLKERATNVLVQGVGERVPQKHQSPLQDLAFVSSLNRHDV